MTLSVNVKNTFVEVKNIARDDGFDVVCPWRRSLTEPETVGTRAEEATNEAYEHEKQSSEGDDDTSVGDGVKDDLNDGVNGDAGWRRCTTSDEDTTECSWEDFQTDDEDTACGGGSLHHAFGDDASANNGFTRVLYTLCPYPMAVQDMTVRSDYGSDELDHGVSSEWQDTVTVMIKNLHNKVTQQIVLDDFTANGFDSTFDFFYLPIDQVTNASKGYAFVNFLTPALARRFKHYYEGRPIGEKRLSKSGKILKVTPATLQGFAANHAHYSTARVQRGHPQTRPLFLRVPRRAEAAQLSLVAAKPAGPTKKDKRYRRGRSLIDEAAKDHEAEQEAEYESHRNQLCSCCHQCGGKVTSKFKFCMYCGTAIVMISQ